MVEAFELYKEVTDNAYNYNERFEVQYRLGNMYYYDKGVKQNYIKAFEWYEKITKTAVLSLVKIKVWYKIGVMYENGEGVEKDLTKAKYYYKKSAKSKNKDAIEALERLKK